MAPEQAQGSANVDVRADVYAVGALLYRMLTGVPPFSDEEDPTIVLTRLLTEDPKRPSDHDRSIPSGVEALIQRAMARSPDARPPTVRELDRLLSAFDTPGRADVVQIVPAGQKTPRADAALGETIAAVPPPGLNEADEVTRRARRARPAAMALTIAVTLTSGAAVLLSALLLLRATTQRPSPSETETILVAVLTLLATLFVLLGAMRVLIARWRSTPAIERLGRGLSTTLRWFFASTGLFTIAFLAAAVAGITPSTAWGTWIDVGLVLVPTALAAAAFAVSLWRARRV